MKECIIRLFFSSFNCHSFFFCFMVKDMWIQLCNEARRTFFVLFQKNILFFKRITISNKCYSFEPVTLWVGFSSKSLWPLQQQESHITSRSIHCSLQPTQKREFFFQLCLWVGVFFILLFLFFLFKILYNHPTRVLFNMCRNTKCIYWIFLHPCTPFVPWEM